MTVRVAPEAEPVTARDLRAGETRGDVLLSFGDPPRELPHRASAAAWSSDPRRGEGRLLWQPRSAGWRGFPVKTIEAGPWSLWRIGESYGVGGDRDEDERLLGVAEGRRPARDLNGHLLLLGWNESARQWNVWTDRFGTVHAYLAVCGSRAALGTYFPAVAAAVSGRRLDGTGLAGFFSFGFFPGDRTFFDDVRILRPASHFVFDASGRALKEERYWAWEHVPDPSRSYDETVDAFASVLHGVTDDLGGGRLAVPISGGLDSRTAVAALTRSGARGPGDLWSYSYGYGPDSAETRIAGEVAQARALPFEPLTVEPYLFDRLGDVLSCVEGFQDVTQARQAVVAERLGERADAVMAAHWGDVWLDDMGLVAEKSPTPGTILDHAFRKMAKRGRRWLLDRVVAGKLAADPEPLLREQLAGELSRLDGISDPDFRVKAYKTEQWSFRWTLASLRMYQAGAFPRLPFYDTRMTDFFASVPSAFVRGRRLQVDYLKRFAPDLARIEWQAYGTNLYRYRFFDSLLLPSRAAKKALRLLRRPVPQRNWEVQLLGAENRRRLEESLIGRPRRLHEFVSPQEIQPLLEAFHAAPFEEGRGYTVSMLLTFSSWLEAHA
jgi:asparagine synthase (glutamine-hydrolysing)